MLHRSGPQGSQSTRDNQPSLHPARGTTRPVRGRVADVPGFAEFYRMAGKTPPKIELDRFVVPPSRQVQAHRPV
jgi:hypothetical protein